MPAKPKYFDAINNECALAQFIPYSSHLNDNSLITKDGALVRIFKLEGTSFETKDSDDLTLAHGRLNSLYKGLSENNISLWSHVIRRKINSSMNSQFNDGFSQHFDQCYNAAFGESIMVNELYLTVVQREDSTNIKKKSSSTIQGMKEKIALRLNNFNQYCQRIEANLEDYEIVPLRIVNNISQPLTFLNYLLTGLWQTVKNPNGEISAAIGNARVAIDTDTIELQCNGQSKYLQGVDIKEYCNDSYIGMFDQLLYVDYEFVLTQSFSFFTKKIASNYLKTRQQRLSSSGDGAITQITALTRAQNDLTDGQFAMGEYHFSLLVMGDDRESTKQHLSSAQKILSDVDMLSAPITIATDAAFFAQLPANWIYRPRVAGMTSRNFASFAPFHNFLIGKKDGNPWGQAVTRLKTLSGHPFFFNFHFTLPGEDNFGDEVAGNTRMIGMTGSGKTVTLGLLYCQAQKYAQNNPFSAVFFDKDRGAEVMIRALGGHYLRVKDGQPTGFNPFQMQPTKSNIAFLKKFVRVLVESPQYPISPLDEEVISSAVNTVMNSASSTLKRLSGVYQNITSGTSKDEIQSSIKLRLKKWCQGGEFGWVFDNPIDELDFNLATNIGIDGTDFLDNDDVRTPISLYLLHRMDEIIDGRRFMYVMDEAWKWVNDAAFSEFVGNKQLTIRKQNGLGVFATQLPSSLLDSPQGAALVQSCSTEIYLPNPKAVRSEYVNGFGLSDKEFDVVKSLGEKSRLCLIKQGKNSAICSLAMPNMKDELTILSAGTKELPLFDEAIEEVGNNPSDWIPVFLTKVKAHKAKSKAATTE
ncbi:VirB4 family type IV secretion/conjugal transfer ATPase (plasmid) [Photobacterium leiognathi subsp. mandapamensis]|uniref:VirB4 family type IV secretion/conjugal transfer ATPase n=1 Tax=Photobacterium leiognathi TaxID=553611 RepID=UPI003AF3AAB1